MTWQDFVDIVSNIFSNSLIASLLGVTVGGFITYIVQRRSIEKQQQFEREKIQNEEHKKNQEIKIRAYNKILHLSSVHIISEWDHHNGQTELYSDKFIEHIQPILYEIYHLLDNDTAKDFDYIDGIHERMSYDGAEEEDKWFLGAAYARIISNIRKEFGNIRNSRSST
ncbi:hypothetical protein [Peribacillus sp. NPDC097295]|uniref:hypothetical protein n=1 Tax=Peribacillus sp. NPDC097295 TaxID=3364402 RepID=UPI0038055390